MEKLKQNLAYLFCAIMGLLNFILLAIPYISAYFSYSYGSFSDGVSGYKVMQLWDGGFGGVMSSLFQIFILVLGICMLVYGICGLLKAFGAFNRFPDKLGKVETKKIAEFGLIGYAGLNVLLLIFLIICVVSNSESAGEAGYSVKAGLRLNAGIFVTLVFAIGAVVALMLLKKKIGDNVVVENYVCSKCGKKANSKNKFCPECGGEIVKQENNETNPE